MIEVKDISKSFNDKQVLENISFTCQPGKINMIIGQSGSGKTVLTKCMVGLFNVDKGEIIYDGRSFLRMSKNERKDVRKEIGMMFQGGALFDSMNVEENVMFPLTMFTDMSAGEKLERTNFCLNRVNLENANRLFPSELSGGMKKRVAIARAIALNPRYLFCDEPNSGLDPVTAIVIDSLIREITYEYNITTTIISHDMNSVMEIGDNIAFIYKGQKWWEGGKDDILHTDNPELCDFIYATRFMKAFREKAK